MPNLKEVKNRINTVISTQQITKAMKMVAASRLRKAQDRILQLRPYAEKLHELQKRVSAGLGEDFSFNLSKPREVINKHLLIVVTSDRGLCGAFNSNVFRKIRALEQEQSNLFNKENLVILPIGKKAYDYYRKRDYVIINTYWDLLSKLNFEEIKNAADFVIDGYQNGTFDKVDIVYNEFKNVATQILRVEPYLPMTSEIIDEEAKPEEIDFIYEPDKDELLKELIPYALKIQFYKAVLESNAAENGARMVAMDQATENASELLKQLRLDYNRTRQAVITREILEIVSGANALESS